MYKQTNKRIYLDRSITLCETGMGAMPMASDEHARLCNLLGLSLKARFQDDRSVNDIDRAIRCFDSVTVKGNSTLLVNKADALRAL